MKQICTLEDPGPNTSIWNMIFDKDNNMLIAANDRIVKLFKEGEQKIIIKEYFPGPCGVTDIKLNCIIRNKIYAYKVW